MTTRAAVAGGDGRPSALPGLAVMIVFLSLIWLGFSDKRDAFHVWMGVACALLVALSTHGLVATGVRRTARGRLAVRYVYTFPWWRLVVFVPWLLVKVLQSNVLVARLVLHPRLPVDPGIVRIRTGLHSDLARTALSAAITLTPGTVVLDIEDDLFVVHHVHPSASDGIAPEMVEMVRRTFEQPEDLPGAPAGGAHAEAAAGEDGVGSSGAGVAHGGAAPARGEAGRG